MQRYRLASRAITLAAGLLLLGATAAQPSGAPSSSAMEPQQAPPRAKAVPHVFEEFGRRRPDDYDWMRKKGDPDIVEYLKAENAYAQARLARIKPLIDELETEGYRRNDGVDETPDFIDNGYVYQRRIANGARFPVITRRRIGSGGPAETVLDVESLAGSQAQYDLNGYVVSPDNTLVAFAVDFTGGRQHRIFIRDLTTGTVSETGIAAADAELAFSADSRHLFYIRTEPGTVRSYQLWRRRLGPGAADEQLLYEERDPTFDLSLRKSKSDRFILLVSGRQTSSEVRYLPADRPYGEFTVIEPRRKGVLYFADHVGDTFLIRTNLDAPDFRIVAAPEAAPRAAGWKDVVPSRPGYFIARFEVFESFLAILEQHDATQSVRVFRRDDLREIPVPRPPGVSVVDLNFAEGKSNRDPSATVLQLRLSALNHPFAFHDFDARTGELKFVKNSPAWSWFDPNAYEVRRLTATAPDGETVPVSLMYRKGMLRPGGNPTLVSAYGAYGFSRLPRFADSWVSLVDRGFVYVIAHVRGGREKGRRWYDQGRMLNKRNSFTDFIAVTERLVAAGLADPKRVFAYGGSAGGMLVGAVANMRPELYAGIVADVPAVDLVTTMADPSLPLAALEYEEWGNSAIREQYDYMLSYSPYDNVRAQRYPPMFVMAGLHDSQVAVHEPAKWVARLRATKTDDNEILFLTNLTAGHAGNSGRFGSVEIDARMMAWLLALAR